ncbi:MAG: hypothetical protein QM811_09580 [Pirellulales bacterium]
MREAHHVTGEGVTDQRQQDRPQGLALHVRPGVERDLPAVVGGRIAHAISGPSVRGFVAGNCDQKDAVLDQSEHHERGRIVGHSTV